MKRVGLRALRNRLGEYVRRVRGGHIVLVVERGEVIAEMLPPGSLDALMAPSGGRGPDLTGRRLAAEDLTGAGVPAAVAPARRPAARRRAPAARDR
jgi:antitoxin (DNA-binding transcriptional repressor) of toxin-antitoxin stability system